MRALVISLLIASAMTAAAGWPPHFVEVRGYSYNRVKPTGDRMYYPLFEDGQLSRTVINKAGARLSASQVQRLLKATTGKHPFVTHAMCFNPHHGFVFYDAANKPVAWVEVCFECSNIEYSPGGRNTCRADFTALLALSKELRLPHTP